MTATEARDHLARLELSQMAFSRLLDVNGSTVRRWLDPDHALDIPQCAALVLRLLTPARAKQLLAEIEAA